MPSKDEFRTALANAFRDAKERGAPTIEIKAGELHRWVGGYPGSSHQMPTCCDVMYDAMGPRDAVLSAPPKGKGASLTIRYDLSG